MTQVMSANTQQREADRHCLCSFSKKKHSQVNVSTSNEFIYELEQDKERKTREGKTRFVEDARCIFSLITNTEGCPLFVFSRSRRVRTTTSDTDFFLNVNIHLWYFN